MKLRLIDIGIVIFAFLISALAIAPILSLPFNTQVASSGCNDILPGGGINQGICAESYEYVKTPQDFLGNLVFWFILIVNVGWYINAFLFRQSTRSVLLSKYKLGFNVFLVYLFVLVRYFDLDFGLWG